MKPREWQEQAIDKFIASESKAFLLEATPGAGKTIFSGYCAVRLFQKQEIDFCLIVVPTTGIKGDRDSGFLGDWKRIGIEITHDLRAGFGPPTDFRGAVITYQQLPNLAGTIQTWQRNGVRIFLICDEIHHAVGGEESANVWGRNAEQIARSSERALAMTGTPFRDDGRRISFVDYDSEGRAKAEYRYTYVQAVTDKVCRPVEFITDDGIANFIRDEEEREMRVSDSAASNEYDISRTIFRHDAPWVEKFIHRGDAKLDEYRAWDSDAAMLVVCRPGYEDDVRHLHQIAKRIEEITGEEPEVVSHDDPKADAKIERFRKSHKRCLCSVRKVSEGVDIKRVRVVLMITNPTTELLFRQLVGRAVRVDDKNRVGDATVLIPKFPKLCEWASNLRDDAQAGLRELEEKENREASDKSREPDQFIPLGSTHEAAGAISPHGDHFTQEEIDAAEKIKLGDPQLLDISVTTIAHIQRKLRGPIVIDTIVEPLYLKKQSLREQITKLVPRIAYARNGKEAGFDKAVSKIYVDLYRKTGSRDLDDLFNNKPIEVMHQAIEILKSWLGEK